MAAVRPPLWFLVVSALLAAGGALLLDLLWVSGQMPVDAPTIALGALFHGIAAMWAWQIVRGRYGPEAPDA